MRPLLVSATVFENTGQDLWERKGFASKVLSHSHRALAWWSTLAEVLRNRFNGFHERVPLTLSSSRLFQEVRRRGNR